MANRAVLTVSFIALRGETKLKRYKGYNDDDHEQVIR
jgi:hypothetical protein